MTNRAQKSYELLFHMIQSQLPEFKPYKVHCDFESAAMNTIKEKHRNVITKAAIITGAKIFGKMPKSLKIIEPNR